MLLSFFYQLTIYLIFFTFNAPSSQAQNITEQKDKRYFIPEERLTSTNSTIEIRPNGDTVLISEFDDVNIQNAGRIKLQKLYKGTPFFKNNWYLGQVFYDNSKPTRGTLAYNVQTGKVLFMVDEKKSAIEIKPDGFQIQNHLFQKLSKNYKHHTTEYFEKLNTSKPTIYKKYTAYYLPTKSEIQKSGYDQATVSEFEGEFKKESFYYIDIDNTLVLINANRRFLKRLNNYRQAVENVIKTQNLDLTKPKHIELLVRAFQ